MAEEFDEFNEAELTAGEAAEAEMKGARPLEHNKFKVELRTHGIVRVIRLWLFRATRPILFGNLTSELYGLITDEVEKPFALPLTMAHDIDYRSIRVNEKTANAPRRSSVSG